MRINVNVNSEAVQAALRCLGRAASDLAPVLSGIGAGIVADAQMRFKDSRDPYGQGWLALSRRTIAQRRKGSNKPLLDTGRLRNSISYRLVGADAVDIGTNVAYAAIHQFGGVIQHHPQSRLVRLRQVKVKRQDGTSYLATRFAKDSHKKARAARGTNAAGWSVRIPARPYLATTARGLPREYGEIIRDQLAAHFRRAGVAR
jgi:phage virion morphogenesis protein